MYAIKGHSNNIMVLTNPRRDWDNKWHVVKVQGIQQTQLHSMNLIKEGLVCCRKKNFPASQVYEHQQYAGRWRHFKQSPPSHSTYRVFFAKSRFIVLVHFVFVWFEVKSVGCIGYALHGCQSLPVRGNDFYCFIISVDPLPRCSWSFIDPNRNVRAACFRKSSKHV